MRNLRFRKCQQIIFLPNIGKSGQKAIKFVRFSKSGKWHDTEYMVFKHLISLFYPKIPFGTGHFPDLRSC